MFQTETSVRSDDLSKSGADTVFYWTGCLAIVFMMVVFIRTTWIADDAMITLRSVMNFTHGYGLVFNLGERAQSFTHTSWFFIVSAVTALIGNPYYATAAVSLFFSFAFLIVVFTNVRPQAFLVFCIVLVCSRSFVDFANSGLENPLSFFLIASLIFTHVSQLELQRKVFLVYLILGLLILTRPDLGVFLIGYSLFFLRKGVLKSAFLGLLPLISWEVFSLFYYGSVIPNSAMAKITTGIPKPELFAQGIVYYRHNFQLDPLTFLTILTFLGTVTLTMRLVWLALCVVLYLCYVFYVGGDFMGGRFLTIPFVASAVGLLVVMKDYQPRWSLVLVTTLVATPLISAQNIYPNLIAGKTYDNIIIYDTGLADERGFYFKDYSLLSGNWPTLPDWQFDETIHPSFAPLVCGFLGQHGLRLGPNVHIIDICGLSDPLLSRLPMKYNGEGNWRIGHFERQVPTDYRAVLLDQNETIKEPLAAALYEDVRLATMENIWSADRLPAIWRLHTHDYEVAEPYAHSDIQAATIAVVRPYDTISHEDADGKDWNSENVVFFDHKLIVEVGAEAQFISLSFDNNDMYDVAVINDQDQVVHTEELFGPVRPGLVTTKFELAERTFVDRIEITVRYGDGAISMGHILVN